MLEQDPQLSRERESARVTESHTGMTFNSRHFFSVDFMDVFCVLLRETLCPSSVARSSLTVRLGS